jgi:hypothetical protein
MRKEVHSCTADFDVLLGVMIENQIQRAASRDELDNRVEDGARRNKTKACFVVAQL